MAFHTESHRPGGWTYRHRKLFAAIVGAVGIGLVAVMILIA